MQATPEIQSAFTANRAAIRNALTYDHLIRHKSVAGPDGCDVCGNTVIVKGRDCITCELAFDVDVDDTVGLAKLLADALVAHVAERGA